MPTGSARQVTVPAVRARKAPLGVAGAGGDGQPLVMVTAYDAPGARIADDAGVDLILVGDSLGMVVLGYPDTLQVTMDDMVHHTAAVSRAQPRALVVADLPWLSYHLGAEDTVRNGARLVRAGAQAVKLEGGAKRVPVVTALVDAEIPVVGHLGLTPQSIHAMGGYKVQATEAGAGEALLGQALALCEAGCFAIVVEGVPAERRTCASRPGETCPANSMVVCDAPTGPVLSRDAAGGPRTCPVAWSCTGPITWTPCPGRIRHSRSCPIRLSS